MPDVFQSLDFRAWLRDAVDHYRYAHPELSLRQLNQRCGFRSSGGLSLVITGKRRLAPETARRVAASLGVSVREQEHFVLLTQWERAETTDERTKILDRMRAAKRFAEAWRGSLHTLDYYSVWYLPVLRELVALDNFREDPDWIAATVAAPITRTDVVAGLHQLEALGMIARDESGRLRQAQPIVATEPEVLSDALVRHQRAMLSLASDALESQPPELRDMRVITTALSRAQVARIKARLESVHGEILAIIAEDEPIEVVYQLNTQWFALATPGETSTEEKP